MISVEPISDDWVPAYRRSAALLYGVCIVVTAFVETVDIGLARILVSPVMPSAIVLWCFLDAQCFGKIFHRSFAWTMMFTWPVGVLAYLIWTRGAKGVGVYFIAVIVSLLLFLVGASLAYLVVG